MNDALEDRLRSLSSVENDADWDGAGDLISQAHARRRRRLTATTTAALAAALAAVAVPALLTSSPVTPGVIAVSDRTAPRLALAGATSSSAPACQAPQLQLGAGSFAANQGRTIQRIEVTNTGPEACALDPGAWRISRVHLSNGREYTKAISRTAATAADDLVLAAGSTANLLLSAAGSCTGAGSPAADAETIADAQVALPDGTAIGVVSGLKLIVFCGQVALGPPIVTDAPETAPTPPLRASISDLDPARRGQTLRYVLTLKNVSPSTYRFGADCPVYTENVYASGRRSTSSEYLNCAGLELAPGESIRFAMQLDVPEASGPAKLGWFLDGGVAAGTAVDVR